MPDQMSTIKTQTKNVVSLLNIKPPEFMMALKITEMKIEQLF